MTSNFTTPWLDIIYQAQPTCKTVELRVGPFLHRFSPQQGGHRLECVTLPRTGKFEWSLKADGPLEIVSLNCRPSKGEFHPLVHNPGALAQSKSLAEFSPVTVQWFVTWKCNYKCEYCWQETVADVYRKHGHADVSAERWVEAIGGLAPSKISLTGGEPTVHPQILELVSGLGAIAPVYITSNLGKSFDVDGWISRVSPERLESLMLSFHPTQVSWEDFEAKWRRLSGHYSGKKVGIELVQYPKNVPYTERVLRLADELGTRSRNIDPYHEQPPTKREAPGDGPCDISPDFRTQEKPELSERPETAPRYCLAGMRRVNIDPLGDVYTCMSAVDRSKLWGQNALGHYKPLGNILEPGFKLNDEPTLCWETFRCSGCDVHEVASSWVDHGSNLKLPLPE